MIPARTQLREIYQHIRMNLAKIKLPFTDSRTVFP